MEIARKMKWFIVGMFILGISQGVSSQDINEALDFFNQGAEANSAGNTEEAISLFQQCIEVCSEIGEDADHQRIKTEALMPTLYLQLGTQQINEKKYKEALGNLKTSYNLANEYNDITTAEKAGSVIPQLHYQLGGSYYKAQKYEAALGEYNAAIEFDSSYAKAYYMKGIVYKKLDDETALQNALDKAIALAEATGEKKVVDASVKLGRSYFLSKGNKAKEAGNYESAIQYLNQTITYDAENATAYYLLAVVNNLITDYDKAIKAGTAALDFEVDDISKTAKIYYELASAYKETSQNDKACEAYQKASGNSAYAEAAKYQIEHVLKCQ
jgi:tetratricopeptide (TPR) repeat protein